MPETSENDARLIGIVVAVGPDKNGEPCVSDLRFGDLVEVSRWTGTLYERHAVAALFGEYGKDAVAYIGNPDGGNESVEMTWDDDYVLTPPECVIAKIADGEWLMGGGRSGLGPGLYPVHKRAFVEMIPEPEGKLAVVSYGDDAHPPCIHGRVLSVGGAVTEVSKDDEVYIEPAGHTAFIYSDGRIVYSVNEDRIVCRA